MATTPPGYIAPDPDKQAFVNAVRSTVRQAILNLGAAQIQNNQFSLLGYGDTSPNSATAIKQSDLIGANSGQTPADISAAMTVLAIVTTAMTTPITVNGVSVNPMALLLKVQANS